MSENTESDDQGKLLTIMIPVFNGAEFLRNLLGQFADQLALNPEIFAERVEIRVINNASNDHTLQVAKSFTDRLPFLKVHAEKVHAPTAEENVFRSFVNCRGEYTWVLGVDDFPVFQNLSRVLDALETRKHDFLIFNSSIIDQSLKFSSYSVTSLPTESIEKDIVELAGDLGLWFVLAGLSNQIVRTKMVCGFDLKTVVEKTSPIYAHVISYLEVFRGRPSVMLSYPLVTYRVTFSDDQHWRKAAAKLNVFDTFFWTLGPVRQFKYLEEKGVIPGDFFFYLRDRNEYSVFRPVHVILNRVIRQLEIMITDRDARNQITRANLQEIQDYISARDPFSRQLIWKISTEYERIASPRITRREKRRIIGDLRLLLHNYVTNGTYAAFFTEQIHGFNIYRLRSRYYAVLLNCNDFFEKQMRDIYGLDDCFPAFFVASTRDELYQKIKPIPELLRVNSYQELVDSMPIRQELNYLLRRPNTASDAVASLPLAPRSRLHQVSRGAVVRTKALLVYTVEQTANLYLKVRWARPLAVIKGNSLTSPRT